MSIYLSQVAQRMIRTKMYIKLFKYIAYANAAAFILD